MADEGELVRRLWKIAKDAQMPKNYYLSETADSTFNEVSKTCDEAASRISALEQRVREAREIIGDGRSYGMSFTWDARARAWLDGKP